MAQFVHLEASESQSQKRHWCFTLNNYLDEDLVIVRNVDCKYICFQPERGESGTRHLQGFITFANGRRLAGVRSLFKRRDGSCTVHLESMRGTAEQAIAYCSKEESRDPDAGFVFEERGDRPRAGTGTAGGRSDLMEVAAAIRDGKRAPDIAEMFGEHFIKHFRGIHAAIAIRMPPRDFKTVVFWYYGTTGTGKSKKAFEDNPDAYWKSADNKWWDGYVGQEAVIIDDYRCNFCTFSNLLRLMDRYPFSVETKGGTVQFVSKRLIITAPKGPEEMWVSRTEEEIGQLTRRIENKLLFTINPFNPTLNQVADENPRIVNDLIFE